MDNYIKQILGEVLYDREGTAKTPAACHLFNVNKGARKLLDEKAQLFHHIVAKLLYFCRRKWSLSTTKSTRNLPTGAYISSL